MRKGKAIEMLITIKLHIVCLKAGKLQAELKAAEAVNQELSEGEFCRIAKDYDLLIEIAKGLFEHIREEGNLPKDVIIGGEPGLGSLD